MVVGNMIAIDEKTEFRSFSACYSSFEEVYQAILGFMRSDTKSSYRISIGTDSQVAGKTVFVTCIHVHRIGKGAIGFLHRTELQRPVKNLREKIYLETCTSLQLAYLFDEEKMNEIYKAAGPKVDFEFHIDVGVKGQTKALISEMVGMAKGIGFVPKIKPDSYCASSFANRYTKAM